MIDCEKCKYYHDNCDSRFRCRIDVEQIREEAYQQGRADAVEDFKNIALRINFKYEHNNLSHEQKQEFTDFISKQILDVIDFISEKIKEQNEN